MKFYAKLVFTYIFILGLAFTFLVPPLQKPDEHGHFKRAILLSKGYVFLLNDGKKLPIEKMYTDIIFDKKLNAIPYHANIKFDPSWYRKPLFASPDDFKISYLDPKGMFILPTIPYTPHAFGLLLSRLLHLGGVAGFFAGRFFMFIFSFFMMIFIYRKTRKPYDDILLFTFSLPMLIHQISGYGYDGMHYIAGAALFCTFINLLHFRSNKLKHVLLFGGSLLLFLLTKLSYEAFFLLFFLIPYRNKLRLFLSVLVSYLVIKLPFFVSSYYYRDNPIGVNPLKQIIYIIHDPLHFAIIFITSFLSNIKFHVQGAIGIFGWLDYSMNPFMYFIWIGAACYLIYSIKLKKIDLLPTSKLFILLAIPILTYALIQTIFYLGWKTVGSSVIDGTQGRYYLILIPYMMYFCVQAKYNKTIKRLLMILGVFVVLFFIIKTILTRYYP